MDFQSAGAEETGKEHRHQAVEISRRRAHGNQGIHVGGAVLEGAPRPPVESPARPELHRRRQRPEEIRFAHEGGKPHQRHNSGGKDSREDKPVPDVFNFPVGSGGDVCQRLGFTPQLVARVPDCLTQVGDVRPLDVLHRGFLRGEVHVDRDHAGDAFQGCLDAGNAGGTGHATYREY